jgi:hypothetical protein
MTLPVKIRVKRSTASFSKIFLVCNRNIFLVNIGFILSVKDKRYIVLNVLRVKKLILKYSFSLLNSNGNLNKDLLNFLVYLLKYTY